VRDAAAQGSKTTSSVFLARAGREAYSRNELVVSWRTVRNLDILTLRLWSSNYFLDQANIAYSRFQKYLHGYNCLCVGGRGEGGSQEKDSISQNGTTSANKAKLRSVWKTEILRSALFWDVTQHPVVTLYRLFGATYRSHLQGSRGNFLFFLCFLIPEDGADTLPRNVGKGLQLDAA
jgi:hypothetical protein